MGHAPGRKSLLGAPRLQKGRVGGLIEFGFGVHLSGWVGPLSPCRVVVGLGRASVGRVGVGSDRVGSGRLRVKLWLGWVGPLSDQGVVSRFGVETGWVDPT